ncbi:MAG: DUF4831 family protein [Muribaculaceae bacterium]|nr:DUF4831 family protein [Muribaculaceae bacterium]MDE6552848.1 DUF4831 family protein [Muribaculaceae bacterium]
MKKIITAMAFLLSFPLGWSQTTKVLTAEKSNEYGLVYSLPTTALDVVVTARHEVARKGPYYLYAKKCIGTDKAVAEDYEKWTITDVQVRPYGVSDSSTQYLMQLKPGALTSITVDSNGMLLAINKEVSAPEAANDVALTAKQNVKWPTGNEYLEFVDEDFVASKSSAKQAQLLAESLMEVRDSKLALTRGTADVMPADGKQMELMLASLGAQEAAITAAFTGSVTTEYITRRFTYVPEGVDANDVLFRMSEFAGFVDADDLSGDPVNIQIEGIIEPKPPVDAKGEPKKLPKNAVIYNIPGSAQVTISTLGKNLYDKEIQMAQTGMTFGIDPTLFTDKKEPSFAVFDPVTGGLLEIGSMTSR